MARRVRCTLRLRKPPTLPGAAHRGHAAISRRYARARLTNRYAEPQQQSTPQQTPTPAAPQQATGGNVLPETRVVAPAERRRPRTPPPRQVVTRQPPAPTPTQAQVVAQQNQAFDAARQTILAPVGATSYEVSHQAIEAQPQGNNATLDKVLLQFPGVTQDSAASGELHVRNEHANIQYRINGIMLPDGVGAFGQILDTGIVGSLALLTGALPAQFGLRTAGVLDIQTKTDAFNNSGKVSVYGGSHGTITPSFEYGGTVGQTQYFVSGRFLQNNLGIENPTPSNERHPRPHVAGKGISLSFDRARSHQSSDLHRAAYPTARIRFPTIPGRRRTSTALG